ncbi:MAG: penicillin-binding protein activator [Proteobacteria bacterium]|nr:penicillin-binding protein activator [Pseudomonadota bacterium]
MKNIFLSFALVALAGCATFGGLGAGKVKYPNAITPQAQAEFDSAKVLYEAQKLAESDAALARFTTTHPYTQLTDEARFLRGEIAFMRGNYSAAADLYRQAYSQIDSPAVGPKARLKAGLSLHRLGRNPEAIDAVAGMQRRHASQVLLLRADSVGVRASQALRRPLGEYVVWDLRVLDDYSRGAVGDGVGVEGERIVPEAEALDEVRRWVNDRSVTAAQVEAMPMKEMKGRRSGGYLMYKKALACHGEGNTDEATKLLKAYVSGYPKHEYYGAARLLMGELGGAAGELAGIAVGVILPLTGKNSLYGTSVLHGVECAIGLYQPCTGPGGVRLVVRDSASFPGGASAAVDDIARDKDVVAIVGPLESADAQGAAQRAQEQRIPLISLSQRRGVAEIGEYAFRNSTSPESEVRSLLDYAVGSRGWKRFFVIYPDTKMGGEYMTIFSQQAQEMGGKVVSSRSYKSGQLQFVSELRGRGAVETMAVSQTLDLSTSASYDAVFIPDSPWVVSSLMQVMMLSGDRKVQLLGIPRWNNPKFAELGGDYVDGAVFVDSFFKDSTEADAAAFIANIKGAYGGDVTFLEALGYDTMRMIYSAVKDRGAGGRESMRQALAAMQGFPGVAGVASFDAEGDAQRKMFVLTIQGGRIRAVK